MAEEKKTTEQRIKDFHAFINSNRPKTKRKGEVVMKRLTVDQAVIVGAATAVVRTIGDMCDELEKIRRGQKL